jgi:hypothetical protein
MARAALFFLLCALAGAALLEAAEGAKKDREDALEAAKGKSPKVKRGAEATTPEAKRRDKLAGCLNTAVNMVGACQFNRRQRN